MKKRTTVTKSALQGEGLQGNVDEIEGLSE